MRFITTIYGNNYIRFLITHVYSISRSHPKANITIIWDDIDDANITILKKAYPQVDFIKSKTKIRGASFEKIPKKMYNWKLACQKYPKENLVFIDVDTIVVKDITKYFTRKFDLLYTYKNEKVPLNIGVVLVKNTKKTILLFDTWIALIEKILKSSTETYEAMKRNGAVDQEALARILKSKDYSSKIVTTIKKQSFTFLSEHCSILNETNSIPINKKIRVIHYKGGWHPVLLQGKPFNKKRTYEDSKDMLEYFLSTEKAANAQLFENIFSQSKTSEKKFSKYNFTYEPRGILNSELLGFIALVDNLGVDMIIESGRANGHSTQVFAKYYDNTTTAIHSVELERNKDAITTEKKLAPYINTKLYYGDSFTVLNNIIAKHPKKRIAVIIDGPKGKPAVELLSSNFKHKQVIIGAIHDSKEGSQARTWANKMFSHTYYTSETSFVKKYAYLDENCKPKKGDKITNDTWRPYLKGNKTMKSYGPTLGLYLNLHNKQKHDYQLKNYIRVAKNFIIQKISIILKKIK